MNYLTVYNDKSRIKLCFRCDKELKDGEMIVRTEGNGRHILRHRKCFTDAKGNPIL